MDEIFDNIDDIGLALDRAKVLDPAEAQKAKVIVDSCILSLQAVSKKLYAVYNSKDSLQDSDTSSQ